MYHNTDVEHPSRREPQTQKDGSRPLYPRQSSVYPHQSAFFVNEYPEQLLQARGQGSSNTRRPPSQSLYQPFSPIDEVYGYQQRTYQELYPTVPPYASSQSFYHVAQAIDKDNHIHRQSNLEQTPSSSPSTTSRALSHHPSIGEHNSYSGDVHPGAAEHGVGLTQSFFDSVNGNELAMANPLWDPYFDVLWEDWQVADPDTGAGELQQFNDETLPDFQLGKHQAYPDDRLGMGRLSYSGRPLQSGSETTPLQFSHEHLISPQLPGLTDVSQLGQATPSMTLASQDDDPPYGNAEFGWVTTSQPSNDTLQHHQPQPYWDSRVLLSDTTTPYQTTEDSSASQNEDFWVSMHPPTPHHTISSSDKSSSGYRTPDHDRVEKILASKQSKKGPPRRKTIHGLRNQHPIAISRIAKKPAKEKAHFFCARGGCKMRVGRLSDLDRHEKTQHEREEDGFACLFCSLEREKKFSVIYNLRAHIARAHLEVDLNTDPHGPTVLSWKDNFPKVPFYKNSLDGAIVLRAHSDVATFLANLTTPSSGNGDPGYFQTAFHEQLEQWMGST